MFTYQLIGKKVFLVALNGEKLSQREILEKLNEIGGQHGIGIIDIVETVLLV